MTFAAFIEAVATGRERLAHARSGHQRIARLIDNATTLHCVRASDWLGDFTVESTLNATADLYRRGIDREAHAAAPRHAGHR